MSDARLRSCASPAVQVRSAMLAALLALGTAASASAQAEREALGARVDSLSAAYLMHSSQLVERRAAAAERTAAQLNTDTTAVGPLLIVDQGVLPPSLLHSVASSVEHAWEAVAAMVGQATAHVDGVVIGVGLDPRLRLQDSTVLVTYPLWYSGRPDHTSAARRVVWAALGAVMPSDVRDWLDGSLDGDDSRMWAYRDLATSGHPAARRCFDRHTPSCVQAVAGDDAAAMNAHTRASLLRHALDVGGDDSYGRLFRSAPDVAGRLSNAAGMPVTELVSSWRGAVQDARPNVHAGVARAGLWTLLWLAGLALLATRSTRWRLG